MMAWWFLAFFVTLAYTIEAITGFGSIVIALSLGALFLPIEVMLPVLVPLNIVMTGYLLFRHRDDVHWPTLLKLILPLMAVGTLLGYGLRPWLGDTQLRLLFGALIVWFAGRELLRMYRGLEAVPHGNLWTRFWMLMAGITHGLFASGGPLLVYALTSVSLDKAAFRATLITVWFSLNSLLTLVFLFDGSLVPALPRVAMFLPLLIVGVVLGEYLHHRVNEQGFRKAVFVVLFATGLLLIAGVLRTVLQGVAG
mgnify:CR=1 FL=1